jgi:broad specificity phosphatase PhoE
MPKLILIKHAKPVVDPEVPSDEWGLGDEGKERATKLVDVLRPYAVAEMVSSTEPKAKQTADIIGSGLGCNVREVEDLHEHDRRNVPHMDTREFISAMAQFFRQPRRLLLGNETAEQAYKRFADAVDGVIEAATGDVAIVTHGTVIALFANRRSQEDAFMLWRKMGLPSIIVFDLPTYDVVSVIDRVD